MPTPDLNAKKAHAVRTARNLRYPEEMAMKIWDVESEDEIAQILKTCRIRRAKEEDEQRDRELERQSLKRRFGR